MSEYVVKYVFEHVEVFSKDGEFLFSADTLSEAVSDIKLLAA